MIGKAAFAACVLLAAPVSSQVNTEPVSDMEATVASYWHKNASSAARTMTADSPERQILDLHDRAVATANGSAAAKAQRYITDLLSKIAPGKSVYKRVSCSDTNCEIVMASPDIAGTSPAAVSLIKRLNDTLLTRNSTFVVVGPSLIAEGTSQPGKGLSMLYYVSLI